MEYTGYNSCNNGDTVQIKTGHVNFKKAMIDLNALYGAELSAHHFKDFFGCDSGMIPWLLVLSFYVKKFESF